MIDCTFTLSTCRVRPFSNTHVYSVFSRISPTEKGLIPTRGISPHLIFCVVVLLWESNSNGMAQSGRSFCHSCLAKAALIKEGLVYAHLLLDYLAEDNILENNESRFVTVSLSGTGISMCVCPVSLSCLTMVSTKALVLSGEASVWVKPLRNDTP